MSLNHQMPATQGEHGPTSLDSRAVPGCAPDEADEVCGPHTLSDHGHKRHCLRKTGFECEHEHTVLLHGAVLQRRPPTLFFVNRKDRKGKNNN